MKRLITVLALFMSAVMLAGCSKPAPEPLPEDGGHVSESDKDAPTQIVSTDIVRFECCFSTLSLDGDDELGNCVYRMKAVLEDDVCSADYSIVSSDGQSVEYSFETDESFMQSLQGIMEDHSLEKNNGLYEKTEGLPDMYGAELRVRYASGESVTAYDNEENFLSPAAMKALKQLFDDDSAVDEPRDEPQDDPHTPPRADTGEYGLSAFDGIYSFEVSEGEQSVLEIKGYDDFLLLEFSLMMEGSTVFYWAEEFWPDEPGDQTESLTGKSQEFSSMFGGVDSYEALPMKRSIILTEEGVAIEYDGLGREDYIKDDSLPRPHDSKEAMAEMMSENIAQTVMDENVAGTYTCWDGINSVRLIFDAEGGFEAVQKSFAKPVRIFEGSWGIDEQSGLLTVMAQMRGCGKQPFVMNFDYSFDEYGALLLNEEEPLLLEPFYGQTALWHEDEGVSAHFTQFEALECIWNSYELSGHYIDEWGTAYDYTFELPQFAALTPALEKINEEILERFEGAIQDSLRAMENNEVIDCDLTGWEMSLHEGMLMLHVYSSYTFEMEDHAAWYYDISEDRRLDGREAAERLGISEDEFLESVRTAAKECYEAHFSHISEAERDSYGYYEMLEWTVSDEAVNFSLPIVLENGRAAVYARIGSLAGAGEFWALVSHFQ